MLWHLLLLALPRFGLRPERNLAPRLVANLTNAFRGQSKLWHNGAKEDPVNIILSFVNAIERRHLGYIRRFALPVIGVMLLLAAPVTRAQTAATQGEKSDAATAGNSENGKKIFTKDGCYECHGREGQGAAQGAGPRIGPPLLSFDGFTKYVHQPTGQMPPYTSKVISNQELADIYAYLQSRPKASPSKDIPLLNQ
jgi:mono/diheme cytochrome c family protein